MNKLISALCLGLAGLTMTAQAVIATPEKPQKTWEDLGMDGDKAGLKDPGAPYNPPIPFPTKPPKD